MVKIKEIKLETIEEALEIQSSLWKINGNYSFKIIKLLLGGYQLEIYEPKKEKLYNFLSENYKDFLEEIKKYLEAN